MRRYSMKKSREALKKAAEKIHSLCKALTAVEKRETEERFIDARIFSLSFSIVGNVEFKGEYSLAKDNHNFFHGAQAMLFLPCMQGHWNQKS